MSRVLVFFGSPRRDGFSARLLRQVIAGAESAGAEVICYHLSDPGIGGCQGCFRCRKEYGCATHDGLHSMYEELKTASGIAAGFPIYFGQIGGQAKQWLDRLYPLYGDGFVPRLPGRKAVTVYAQANADRSAFAGAIENTDSFFRGIGWDVLDSILVSGNVLPGYTLPQDLLDRAFEAGRRLAQKQ